VVPDILHASSASVLVVEDDDDLRGLFRDSLRSAGFEVSEASDGPAALAMLDDQAFDVVVLDIWLPTMDGVAVREQIAANAHTADIAVIVVTGTVVDVNRLPSARVLHKPIDPIELVDAVRASLAQVAARRLAQGYDISE
jgi:DNA-binding response OmpR family regulator